MVRVASISGFPEWLPSQRLVEQAVIDTIRRVFELNGFIGIETRAVEPGSSLLKKGETSKEIYLLSRLQEVGHESETAIEDRLGLHFDLTVPLSRYVVEHAGSLTFPFKRWQMQKVWRGERPQAGRFREFTQADIDVVGSGDLPGHYEVELPLVMVGALEELRAFGLPKATLHVNNRKLSEGFYRSLGIRDVEEVLHQIDKLDKVGFDEVARLLVASGATDSAQAQACLELAQLKAHDADQLQEQFDLLCDKDRIDRDTASYDLARQGLETLTMVIEEAARIRPGSVVADLKIARGLDYYTGSVYETFLEGASQLGSICSGGRYDNLATQGSKRYPGVGLSIGLTRLVSYMLHDAGARTRRVSPAVVLIAVWSEEHRSQANITADLLRARGIAADVSPNDAKIGKQIKYADKLGIPYVWFPAQSRDSEGDNQGVPNVGGDQVKNIVNGEQVPADAKSWEPDIVYAQQSISL